MGLGDEEASGIGCEWEESVAGAGVADGIRVAREAGKVV